MICLVEEAEGVVVVVVVRRTLQTKESFREEDFLKCEARLLASA